MGTNWQLRCPDCAKICKENLGIKDYGDECVCWNCGSRITIPNPWKGPEYEARKVIAEKIKDALRPRDETKWQRRYRLVSALLHGIENEDALHFATDYLSDGFEVGYVYNGDLASGIKRILKLDRMAWTSNDTFANAASPKRVYWACEFFCERMRWERESEKWKDPEHCCTYPALEMEVYERDSENILSRIVPLACDPSEHWLNRWIRAKKRRRQGRFVALYGDPVWRRISLFDDPLPPFDFDPHELGFSEVDWCDAQDLRLKFKTEEELELENAARRKPTVQEWLKGVDVKSIAKNVYFKALKGDESLCDYSPIKSAWANLKKIVRSTTWLLRDIVVLLWRLSQKVYYVARSLNAPNKSASD